MLWTSPVPDPLHLVRFVPLEAHSVTSDPFDQWVGQPNLVYLIRPYLFIYLSKIPTFTNRSSSWKVKASLVPLTPLSRVLEVFPVWDQLFQLVHGDDGFRSGRFCLDDQKIPAWFDRSWKSIFHSVATQFSPRDFDTVQVSMQDEDLLHWGRP